jgi:Raf kinase inhibitor-like YbhB/YbcL family protein
MRTAFKLTLGFTLLLVLLGSLPASTATCDACCPPQKAAKLTLTSSDLKDGSVMPELHVYNGFGRTGNNVSPALKWSAAPEGTKSFAVTVYDPDAPTGSGWWHWIVLNIPPTVTELVQGASGDGKLPAGALETRTDYGKPGYGGAAPPKGEKHRYIFTIHALKTDKIDLPADASGAMAGFFIKANTLASTSLTVTYEP